MARALSPLSRFLLTFGVATASLAAAGHERSAGSPPWRGWDRYQVLMWSVGEPVDRTVWFRRLQEMGCTGEECPRSADSGLFVKHDFGFYVENLVPDLAFLHARGALYDEDFRGYVATRDRRHLTRRPCLDDPAFQAEVEARVRALVRRHAGNHPLLYNLQDELSLGRFASPMDYCFCPHTLRAFREWLRTRYANLAALNREWETGFRTWDDVAPLTTWEIKAREKTALAAGKPENYAPWADHREYMDAAFARTLGQLRDSIQREDPLVPVGIEGTQMPSAWGGHDLWRLSRVIDWVEPYDIGNSRLVLRSFLPQGAPVLSTVFGTDYRRLERRLWTLLLQGDRGCILWDDERARCIAKDRPDQPLTERGRELAALFPAWKAAGPQLWPLRRERDRIAIHYSQASIRAHWMFDSREDGDTWPRRFSSYEATHSRLARVRDGFVKVLEDLGFQPEFVSYEQLETGALRREGYRALLLPQSVAMSEAECRAVEVFAREGGTVLADALPAIMDEHGKRRERPRLDTLFGVEQGRVGWRATPVETGAAALPLTAYDADLKVRGAVPLRHVGAVPVGLRRAEGRGAVIFLNLRMADYPAQRLRGTQAQACRDLFERMLAERGLRPVVRVRRAGTNQLLPAAAVWRYAGEGREVIGIHRNPGYEADEAGAALPQDTATLEQAERIEIRLPGVRRIRDLVTGAELGRSDRVAAELSPWKPVLLDLRKQSGAAP